MYAAKCCHISIVCTPPPPGGGGGGGVEPPTKFSKRGGNFFQGDCNFYKKTKRKSEIFNDKKSF